MRRLSRPLVLLPLLACAVFANAHAYVVSIGASPAAVYLRVGNGAAGTTYLNNGGNPGNSGVVNLVSVAVPAAALGSGPQAMLTNATQLTSSYDGFAFCNANEIYIGGFNRGTGGVGRLTATAPVNLTDAGTGQTIAFSQISWTSSGNGDGTTTQPVLAGTFSGGVQTLAANFAQNTWRESCHSFRYANGALVAAGTYTGRVIYTLSAP